MSQPSSDPRPMLVTLPTEILLKILGYVMESDAPMNLKEFVNLGREVQHRSETGSWDSDEEAYPIDSEDETLSTPATRSVVAWEPSSPSEALLAKFLHSSQREHYHDWLLINSTCRRIRELGKVAFFSEKRFIIDPTLVTFLNIGVVKNLSAADTSTAFAQIRHVIAPLEFDTNGSLRDFRILPRYHSLRCMKILSIRHLPYAEIVRPLPRPVVVDLAAVDRIPSPQQLLDLLRDLGLELDRFRVDLVNDGDKDILGHLASEVYPALQSRIARDARKARNGWRR